MKFSVFAFKMDLNDFPASSLSAGAQNKLMAENWNQIQKIAQANLLSQVLNQPSVQKRSFS